MEDKPQIVQKMRALKFRHKLTETIKNSLKAYHCEYNTTFEAWLCPLMFEEQVKKIIEQNQLIYDITTCSVPDGLIPPNKNVRYLQTKIDILLKEILNEDNKLSLDILSYDKNLRLYEFQDPPSEENKNAAQLRQEKDFYLRHMSLDEKRKELGRLQCELKLFEKDKGYKIFSAKAPLSIADCLMQSEFMWQGEKILYNLSGSFWFWNTKSYQEKDVKWVRKRIYHFLRDAKTEKPGHDANEKVLNNFNPSKSNVDQVVDALISITYQDEPFKGVFWFDGRNEPDPKYLFSFENGILNIKEWLVDKTTKLMPHTPLLFNSNSLPFEFSSDVEEPAEWFKFLSSIWENDDQSISTLQEWMGYILTQDTKYHKILLLVGPPRSGKGTIAKVISSLLGENNIIGPTFASFSNEFGLQYWLNKMVAIFADARLPNKNEQSVITERLLSISGEDILTINRKYKEGITTKLPTRIIIMTNELPDIRDASGALTSRYIVLPLSKSWLGQEDPLLVPRLIKELPGILHWALEGLHRLEERGYFIQPTSALQHIDELQTMASPIQTFIKQKCELGPLKWISIDGLYQAWKKWCEEVGHDQPGNKQHFGRNLRTAVPQIKVSFYTTETGKRDRKYEGISLACNNNS